MAKPEVEDTVFIWIGRIQAFQTYAQLISQKPETNFDGKNNVLLSMQPLREVIKDGILEVGEVEDGIHRGESPPTYSISIRYPDHRVQSVVRVSRVLTLAKDARQLSQYLKSFCSYLRDLLHLDEHLSNVIVEVCNDAEDDLEPAIRKTVEKNLEHCENPSFSTQNIGLGLACLYFFDQLYPVLHGMDERIGRWSRGKLLPTVVIDCSNDQATAENEQLKAIGWTTIVADPSRKTQGLINCEVFQLEHDTVEPHVVIIERPQAIWTLQTFLKFGKLSREEYERESHSFIRMLNGIIAEKVDSGLIKKYQCSVYDGNDTNLADHIWSCAAKYKNEHGKHKSTWNELPLTLCLLPRNNVSSFCKLLMTFLFGHSWTESASE